MNTLIKIRLLFKKLNNNILIKLNVKIIYININNKINIMNI